MEVGAIAIMATNLIRLADILLADKTMTEDKARRLVLETFELADADWERAVEKFRQSPEDQALRTMSGKPLITADGEKKPAVAKPETPPPAVAGPRTSKK